MRGLTRLYAASRLHTDVLQPSFKLRSKSRIGAMVVKRYHPPVPPAIRVLAHAAVNSEAKAILARVLATADPVVLLDEIRATQEDLGHRVNLRGVGGPSANTDDTVKTAATTTPSVHSGERRAIHRRPYRRRKPVPRKPRMLDAYEDQARSCRNDSRDRRLWRFSGGCETRLPHTEPGAYRTPR